MTIVEFIEARLAEEEQAARDCPRPDGWSVEDESYWFNERDPVLIGRGKPIATFAHEYGGALTLDHVVRHDPQRVLAQVAAMRRMLELRYSWALQIEKAPEQVRHVFEAEVNAADAIIQGFAAVWSSHDDYDPAWAPEGE